MDYVFPEEIQSEDRVAIVTDAVGATEFYVVDEDTTREEVESEINDGGSFIAFVNAE